MRSSMHAVPQARRCLVGIWSRAGYGWTSFSPANRKTREKTQSTREETAKGDTAAPSSTGKTSERILALAQKAPGNTTGQMATEVGISRKGVEWQIRRLKRAGRLERLGPAKGGRWRVVGPAVE